MGSRTSLWNIRWIPSYDDIVWYIGIIPLPMWCRNLLIWIVPRFSLKIKFGIYMEAEPVLYLGCEKCLIGHIQGSTDRKIGLHGPRDPVWSADPWSHFFLKFTSWLFQIRPIKIILPTCIKWLIREISRRSLLQTLQVAFKTMLAQWTFQQKVITSVSKLSLFRMNFFKYLWCRISGKSAWCSLQKL